MFCNLLTIRFYSMFYKNDDGVVSGSCDHKSLFLWSRIFKIVSGSLNSLRSTPRSAFYCGRAPPRLVTSAGVTRVTWMTCVTTVTSPSSSPSPSSSSTSSLRPWAGRIVAKNLDLVCVVHHHEILFQLAFEGSARSLVRCDKIFLHKKVVESGDGVNKGKRFSRLS